MDLLRDATHLTLGTWETLYAGGARRIVPVRDSLETGPCDAHPQRHRRLRLQYWKSEYALVEADWDLEPQPRWPSLGPVALWTSSAISDRLLYWNAIDRLAGLELWRIDARHPKVELETVRVLSPDQVGYSVERG